MPPPLMPPSIQKPQKSAPNSWRTRSMSVPGIEIAGPGNDGLDGAGEVAVERGAQSANVAALEEPRDLIQDPDGLPSSQPFGFRAEQVLLGDHLEDGADVLRHAAMHQHQALLQPGAGFARDFGIGEDFVIGEQAPAADSEFGIAFGGARAVDQLDAGPDAARILPAAAASAQPFTQNGTRGNQTPVVLFHASGERTDLPGGAHRNSDDRGQQAGGDGQARAPGDAIHLADEFNAVAGFSGEAGQQTGQRFGGTFDAGRHDAAGDDARFEQTEIIAGEVEDFGDGRDVGGSAQIDAGQADHRLVDDAEPSFDRRLGLAGWLAG